MTNSSQNSDLVLTPGLNAYFHESILRTAREQRVQADGATLHYLTLLLSRYARSEAVFDYADQRTQLRPLAMLYASALDAPSRRERRLWLQRLGDLALFVGGLFSGQLNRHFRDLDYCVAMGGNAYGYLCDTAERNDEAAQAEVFGELAQGFDTFVGVVAVVTGRQAGNTLDA